MVIYNLLVSCMTLLVLFAGIRRKAVVLNRIWYTVTALALASGCIAFNVHTMCIWALLVFHSYTDITEGYVYSNLTWYALAVEIILCVIQRAYMDIPMYEMIFPGILIIAISKLVNAYAGGDMEIFLLTMLAGYNSGHHPGGYMMSHMFVTCVIFVIYMGIVNLLRIIRHEDTIPHGPFLPAMTVSFFIIEIFQVTQM